MNMKIKCQLHRGYLKSRADNYQLRKRQLNPCPPQIPICLRSPEVAAQAEDVPGERIHTAGLTYDAAKRLRFTAFHDWLEGETSVGSGLGHPHVPPPLRLTRRVLGLGGESSPGQGSPTSLPAWPLGRDEAGPRPPNFINIPAWNQVLAYRPYPWGSCLWLPYIRGHKFNPCSRKEDPMCCLAETKQTNKKTGSIAAEERRSAILNLLFQETANKHSQLSSCIAQRFAAHKDREFFSKDLLSEKLRSQKFTKTSRIHHLPHPKCSSVTAASLTCQPGGGQQTTYPKTGSSSWRNDLTSR
ncbi:uncharacterized protein [Muntiacus reevesi]|uniref:uncharacterized protein n=1 Tax=Muntiacus reevesi TaxID=9886 RepID=UPI0033073EA4